MPFFITDEDVKRLLSFEECVAAMRLCFKDFAAGDAVNRPRLRYTARTSNPEQRYFANIHAGAVPSLGLACVRGGSMIVVPPGPTNDRRLFASRKRFNYGLVLLYSTDTAECVAIMNEFEAQRMRVGATSALAVDLIARPDVVKIGLFGTGSQARSALEALSAIRPVRECVVYSPNPDHLAAFVKANARPGLDLRAAREPREVVAGADVVLACTTAMKPVIEGAWLEDGQMVVTIANSDATNKRSEADRRVFERAGAIVVNDWGAVEADEQTELLEPIAAGAVKRERVIELGQLAAGTATVKQPPKGAKMPGGGDIVYFKNNGGLAIQLVAAAAVVYRKLQAEGSARAIPDEWARTDLSKRWG
ncbi:MAG TPA: NAD(P)-binding domain-containing protein [Alphaproteobacteria bacterium]|nr:NAD(P)-binding domain-containing protein [Alphaproteobacteria bacterium]